MNFAAIVKLSRDLGQATTPWLLAAMCCLLAISASHAAQTPATATSSAVAVAYCTGKEVRLTLSDARECDYVSYNDATPAVGGAPRWAKVTAEFANAAQVLTLNVGPHLVRGIEIFDGGTGQLLAGPVGTAYPYSPEHGLLVGYSFSLAPGQAGEHVYYVRIETISVPYAFVQASLDPLSAQEMNQRISLGIHLGVLGLLVLISGGVYAVTRTPIMGVFALVILNLLLSTMAGSGLLFKYLWPDWPRFNELFFGTMFFLRAGLWLWLAQTFLAPYTTPRWYRPGCQLAYGLVAIMIVLVWFGYSHVSTLLGLVFAAFVFPVAQIIAISMTNNIRLVYQRILMSGYALGALGMWAALLVVAFPTDNPELPIQITRVIDYATPVILLGLVMFHYRETMLQLAASQEENVKIRMGLELERKLQHERKLMVDMLTHELKNPLASINMAIGSLSSSLRDDDGLSKRRLQNMERSVHSMDTVIERCNLMNQLDQSALQCQPSRISLQQTLADIIARSSDAGRLDLTIEGADVVVTDPQFFQMIMSNLIDNALKYSPAHTKVTVCAKHVPTVETTHATTHAISRLTIEVANTVGAKGAPDAAMVFTRFYRHPSAHQTSGSGVGLYLSQSLAKLMGGEIHYQSNQDRVLFRVELPEPPSHA